MELNERDRLGTRLLALNLRLFELNREMEQSQIRVHQLESSLEDARLASMLGEDAGDAQELGSELERERHTLEHRRAVVDRVRDIQWKARVQHAVAGLRQRQQERASASAVSDESAETGGNPDSEE